jgi:hypothetical protein
VRAAAIELLGQYPDQEEFLLEQADEKRKELRRAAYMALSRLGTERAQDRLYRVLDSKGREMAIEPIRQCEAAGLALRVVRHAEAAMDRFLEGENRDEAIAQLLVDIECVQDKALPEVTALFKRLLSTGEMMVPETERLLERSAQILLQLDLPEADRFALELQHLHKGRYIAYSLRAAVKTLSPGEVYDRFAPVLKDKKSPAAKDLLRKLENLIPSLSWQLGDHGEEGTNRAAQWDPRWSHLLADADEEELVCRLALQRDKKLEAYLVKKCKETPGYSRQRTPQRMVALYRLGCKETPELLMNALEQGGGKVIYYLDRLQTVMLELLPASYAERLKRFAESLAQGSVRNEVLEIAEALQSKQAEAQSEDEKGTGLWGWLKNKMS